MKLHEYQVKKLLSNYGVNIVKGGVAYTPSEAYDIAYSLGKSQFYVKAQSISVDKEAEFLSQNKVESVSRTTSAMTHMDVMHWAKFMLGNKLFDKEGKEQEIRKVYIEKAYTIKHSMYLSLMFDYKTQSLMLISSDNSRSSVVKEKIPLTSHIKLSLLRKIFVGLGLDKQYISQIKSLFKAMYKAFIALDILKLEISELILTSADEILVKEVDVFFDESSLYRHKNLQDIIDFSEMSKEQELAYKWGTRYIPHTGNISIMTNGIGLGLALADMISLCGGEVAQIIDIGWNADRNKISRSFQFALRSVKVDGLLIYVYGGSLHCDEVARGIITAVKEMSLDIPFVVRLGGTNEELANNLLASSGLPIIISQDMASSSEQIVDFVRKKQ